MRIAEKICGVLVFFSLLSELVLIRLPYRPIVFVFAFLTIALIYFPLGFAFFNEIRLRKIFKSESYKGLSPGRILGAIGVGISLSPICLGIMFKFQHWPGANNMLEAGLIPSFIILIIAIYKYFKSTDHYYKRIVIRLLIIGVFGLTLLFTTQLRLVKIQFRNHPQYVHAYELSCKNPEDGILRYKLEIEYARATMSDEDFKLYQSDEDFIYHQKLLEELEATQPTNESASTCSKIAGLYSGTSRMGRSSGTAEITINSDCSATLRYDHGSLGAATEYGVIADNGAKFDKSSGGSYDLSISGNQVVLEGTSWRCVMTRGLSGNSSSPQSQVKDYVNCDNCRKKMYDGQDAVTLRTNPDKLFCSQYCADYWFASH